MSKGLYVVITPFFPMKNDFRGSFVYDYVMAVKRSGRYDDVIVFRPTIAKYGIHDTEYNGVKVYNFLCKNFPSYFFNGVFNRRNARSFMLRFEELGFDVNAVAVAHAHVSSYGAMALELKKRNPDIVTLLHHHDPDPYTVRNGQYAGNWLNLYVRASINRRIFEKIDMHVCISEYVRQNLLLFPHANPKDVNRSYLKRLKSARRLGLRQAKIKRAEVLYNGVDISIFNCNGEKKEHEKFVIGSIGNFIDWKDQITLLKALKIIHDKRPELKLKAILIGNGPTLTSCKQYVVDNQLDELVEFRAEASHDKMADFLRSLDLFVLPSTFEGFGCVFTEAAACGVPFICCDNAGASEYLTKESKMHFAISPGDYESLVEDIISYIDNPTAPFYRYSFDINILVNNFLNKLNI